MDERKSKVSDVRRWGIGGSPLPQKWVPGFRPFKDAPEPAFDFSSRMRTLCRDVADRCPTLGHIDPALTLITFTASRSRSFLLTNLPLRDRTFLTSSNRRIWSGVRLTVKRSL